MRELSARAEVVTRRTYCRPLNDEGTKFEVWEDVVDRVISHQRWLWERALTHNVIPGMMLYEVTEDMSEWVCLDSKQNEELEELRQLFLDRKCLPAGRGLWLANTPVAKTREASQFNCSFLEVETVYDMVDILWLLLQGCGVGVSVRNGTLVGFRNVIPEVEIINTKRTTKGGRHTNEESFDGHTWTLSVGDSAEAWAKSIGKLLAGKPKASKLVIDLTEIRPDGDRLKGYGWISSGSEPLGRAYKAIAEILNNKAGAILSKMDIIDIINHLGTVLSSRRSAEIILVESTDLEAKAFASAKKECFTEGFKHRQQSNNSLLFKSKPSKLELMQLFATMVDNGGSEPGFINGETALKRAPYFKGINPCAEITLPNKGFCNLVEIDVSRFIGDTAGLLRAAKILARANYRQTIVDFRGDGILQEAWTLNNNNLHLCGVGVTGVAYRDDMQEYDWKQLKYAAVFGARSIADELELPYAANTTTLKPSGTVSKIMDTTEGVHRPMAKYIFNWINFSNNDPLLSALKDAGYRLLPNPGDVTSTLACLPVTYEGIEFDKRKVTRKDGTEEILEINTETAIQQLERYKKLQMYYCEQNVSNTISYSPEEVEDIVDWLLANWDIYVGVSFLFRADPTLSAKDLGYEYLPQETVTKSTYDKYVSTLSTIDFEGTDSFEELEDDGCATGACPIK